MRSHVILFLAFLTLCSMNTGCSSRKTSSYLNLEAPTRALSADREEELENLREEREREQRRLERARAKEEKARLKEQRRLEEARLREQRELEKEMEKARRELAEAEKEDQEASSPSSGKRWWWFDGDTEEGVSDDADMDDMADTAVTPSYRYRLKPGDQLVVSLLGVPNVSPVEDIVDENGNIKLDYLDTVPAAGKTSAELESYIQQAYLDAKIYKNLSVSVVLPMKSYFIRGEVLKPGRFPLLSGVTLLQSIAAAGGFNEYANPKKVTIIRAGRTIQVNAAEIERDATQDVTVEEGDVIVVRRSFL